MGVFMSYVVCVAAHKGGVGKTSMSCWLADAAQRADLKVLLVDGDPQGAASDVFGWEPQPLPGPTGAMSKSLAEWYAAPLKQTPEWLVYKGHPSGVHLVPNTMEAFATAHQLEARAASSRWSPGAYVKELVQRLQHNYDLVIIDSPPHWDIHLLNCLRAAKACLIPLTPDAKGLKGVQLLLGLMKREMDRGAEMPSVLGLCIHRTKPRTRACRDVSTLLRESYGEALLGAEISDSVSFAESDAEGHISPLTARPGSPTGEQILKLAEEIFQRLSRGRGWEADDLPHITVV